MAAKYEFRDEQGEHTAAERRRRIVEYLSARDPAQPLAGDPRALSALSAWVYKSNHTPASGWRKSPTPDQMHGPLDAPAGGVALPLHGNTSEGYDGVAFYRPGAAELLIVNRGTETEADWLSNIGSILGGDTRSSKAAIAYAVACVKAVRDANKPLDRVTCTGHSLGGAMAEAQAALLNTRLADPVTVTATGFASAGFRKSLTAMATPADLNAALTHSRHYTRVNDPITNTYGSSPPWASLNTIRVNVYEVVRRRVDNAPDSKEYYVDSTPLAHSSYLYFYLWDQDGSGHYFRTYTGGHLRRRQGNALDVVPFGLGLTIHKDYR